MIASCPQKTQNGAYFGAFLWANLSMGLFTLEIQVKLDPPENKPSPLKSANLLNLRFEL